MLGTFDFETDILEGLYITLNTQGADYSNFIDQGLATYEVESHETFEGGKRLIASYDFRLN
jgi:hypothetical protein